MSPLPRGLTLHQQATMWFCKGLNLLFQGLSSETSLCRFSSASNEVFCSFRSWCVIGVGTNAGLHDAEVASFLPLGSFPKICATSDYTWSTRAYVFGLSSAVLLLHAAYRIIPLNLGRFARGVTWCFELLVLICLFLGLSNRHILKPNSMFSSLACSAEKGGA